MSALLSEAKRLVKEIKENPYRWGWCIAKHGEPAEYDKEVDYLVVIEVYEDP